jgi:hypothetical protein
MDKLQEFSSRDPTMPQLTSSNCTPTHGIGLYPKAHGHNHSHTHTNSHEKFYISFCVLPRLSLSLSLSRCSPSTHHPLSVALHSRECPLLHHQILIFFSNQILLLKALSCFLPKFHSKLWPTFLAPSKTSQANKQTNRLLHHYHHHLLPPSSSATHTWDVFFLLMWWSCHFIRC